MAISVLFADIARSATLQYAPRGQRFALCHLGSDLVGKRASSLPSGKSAPSAFPHQIRTKMAPQAPVGGAEEPGILIYRRPIFVYFEYFVVIDLAIAGRAAFICDGSYPTIYAAVSMKRSSADIIVPGNRSS